MDAKAGIKADQRQERLKAVDKNVLGAAAAGMGNRRCVPGSGATSFGAVHASDERALARVLCDRASGEVATVSLDASRTGRSSPASGRSSPASGRSGPATTPVSLPALGHELSCEMSVLDTDDLGKLAGATRDEINLFVNTGFAEDEMGRGLAVKIMEEVIKSRLNKVRNGKNIPDYIADECVSDQEFSVVVGLDALCLAGLCLHYGVDDEKFFAIGYRARWYVNGWEVSNSPTVNGFDCLTKVFASILVGEHYGDSSSTILGNGDKGGGGVGDDLHSAPGRQSKSGRKSRKNTNRDVESNLER